MKLIKLSKLNIPINLYEKLVKLAAFFNNYNENL